LRPLSGQYPILTNLFTQISSPIAKTQKEKWGRSPNFLTGKYVCQGESGKLGESPFFLNAGEDTRTTRSAIFFGSS
jgi:hypothetical protein